MAEHLPECELSKPCSPDTPQHGICNHTGKFCIHCEGWCMCEELQSVANLAYERGVKAGYAAGYVEAVSIAQCLLEEHVDSRGWVALTKMATDVPTLSTVQR